MEKEMLSGQRAGFRNWSATRVIVTTVGVVFGLSGMNHGLFEILQGNTPTASG
jgi:hypothetical protein